MQTRVQKALSGDDEEAQALRDLLGELLTYPDVLRHLGELVEGSAVRYDTPAGRAWPHPLTGGFVPDLGLAIGGRKTRVAELMRAGRFVLLDLTAGGRVAATAVNWSDPVPIVAEPLSKPAPADVVARPVLASRARR